jgi:hypothetical protein
VPRKRRKITKRRAFWIDFGGDPLEVFRAYKHHHDSGSAFSFWFSLRGGRDHDPATDFDIRCLVPVGHGNHDGLTLIESARAYAAETIAFGRDLQEAIHHGRVTREDLDRHCCGAWPEGHHLPGPSAV